MPSKTYLVTLTEAERLRLTALVSVGKRSALTITRARILVKADQAPRWLPARSRFRPELRASVLRDRVARRAWLWAWLPSAWGRAGEAGTGRPPAGRPRLPSTPPGRLGRS